MLRRDVLHAIWLTTRKIRDVSSTPAAGHGTPRRWRPASRRCTLWLCAAHANCAWQTIGWAHPVLVPAGAHRCVEAGERRLPRRFWR